MVSTPVFRAVSATMCSLFFPLLPFAVQLVVLAFWAVTAVYLASSGTPACRVVDAAGALTNESCDCASLDARNASVAAAACQFTKYEPLA